MQDVHIGPLPPPIGGISVYLYRLSKIEKNSHFINELKTIRPNQLRSWFIKQIFNFKKKNYIYHSHSLKRRLLFYFLSCISIHEFSLVIHGRKLIDQYNNSNLFKKFLIRKMLKRASFVQVVNPQFKTFINDFLKIRKETIFVKNAFLPPPIEEEKKILKSYNNEILSFLEYHTPLIISNAGVIRFYNKIDLYGLDMCIQLIFCLKQDFPNIGFLFALADDKMNSKYINEMRNKIKKLNIEKNFFIFSGQKEIWPIFKHVDLMVRPTYIDAYGSSIAEALYFNCPVIASNVCKRPEGTILFKNRELEDLLKKCKSILIKNCNRKK